MQSTFEVIIGHGPGCTDGATAMWSVWRTLTPEYRNRLASEGGFYSTVFGEHQSDYVHPNSIQGALRLQNRGFPVVFVFVQPNTPIPTELVTDKNVLILDLDLGDHLIPIVEQAKQVCLCDHHDSTLNTLTRHESVLKFNASKFTSRVDISAQSSGATLAWKLFHSEPIPPMVEIVRIGDNWAWEDRTDLHPKEVLHALFDRRVFRSFDQIEHVFQTWNQNFNQYVTEGSIMVKYETSLVKQVSKQCELGYIQTQDGTVYTIAYTQANFLRSEIGATMKWYAEKRFRVPIDFCATWNYVPRKKLVSVSLRDPSKNLDLSIIARTVKNTGGNGGGHVKAAGFSFYGLDRLEQYIHPVHPHL